MANKPNNPSLWSRAKSLAKQKFDVYPSAYANGWAAKWYKSKGGTWSKAKDGMEVPDNAGFEALPPAVQRKIMDNMAFGGYIPQMADGGKMPPEIARARFVAAGNADKLDDYGYAYGGYIPEMAYGGSAQQAAIAIAMKKAGKTPKNMKDGGEPNGEMALGQMAAVQDKMSKLLQFVQPDDNLDPWIASKLAVMDHSADAISDYMMYGPEANEMEEMKSGGGIPERYRNKGFTRVGAKRQSNRPGKKWMVLAKKGDDYKIVHGGYKGMKDYTQHGNAQRRENFWNRMGGKNSAKATDPFSPLYWHKRFGTWQEGGEIEFAKDGKNYSIVDYLHSQGAQSDFATRKKLAETIYGINNYAGTAEQNTQLLKYMSGEQPSPGQPIVKDYPTSKNAPAPRVKKAPVDKPLPGKASGQRAKTWQDIVEQNLSANFKNERDLQSGFVVDKRSNTGYIIENGQVKRSFPVLTGLNPEGTSNTYTVEQLEKYPEGRVTAAGTYMMQPRPNIYGAPGFHMNPIAAFGDPAAASKYAAVHTTYDPAVRSKYYNMDADQRYRSFGCVNCRKPDISELTRTFPQGDTLMVIDPKNSAKDRRYLNRIKKGKQEGGLIEYADGDFVPSGLPKYDAQKGMLNILNPFAKAIDDPFKNSFYNPFTREYGPARPSEKPKVQNPYNKNYDYLTPTLVNMGLNTVAGIAQGISDNRNINYNTSDSLMPVVRNNYSRGRNEINTGRYADDSLVPVQFAGTPVAEYYGAPMYQMAEGGSFDVSSGILGLPKMRDDVGDYREAQLNFDIPMNTVPPSPENRTAYKSSGANPLAEQTWADVSSQFQGVKHLGIWGDKRHQKTKSDHNSGDALDIGINSPDQGQQIAQKLIKEAGDRNVKYIIWNKQIWNPSVSNEWRPYTGDNPHTSHVHVSFNRSKQDLGQISLTHNNPLNIHQGDFASKYGGRQGSKDGGGYVSIFPDMNTGITAAKDLLFGPAYSNLTVSQARNKWVSGNSGTPNESTPYIVKAIGADKKVKDLSTAEREKLIKEFAKWEGRQAYDKIKNMSLYAEGGEYDLSEAEIQQILMNGGQVEFL